MPSNPAPARIGPCRLLAKVGQGGMGEVYRAHHPGLGTEVAVKVLAPALVRQPEMLARFRREAEASARLDHPGLVRVHEFGDDRGLHYLVMEFLEGTTLRDVLRAGGPLRVETSFKIFASAAEALHHAHEHGLVHRDVKPANVMITRSGQVKITDFGLAKPVESEDGLTQTGQVLGTPQYMSPEQAEGAKLDRRTDVYSLGISWYECLAGAHPFQGTIYQIFRQIHQARLEPIDLRRPDVPPRLGWLLAKMMSREASERPAHLGLVLTEIASIRAGTAPPTRPAREAADDPAPEGAREALREVTEPRSKPRWWNW